MKGDKAKCSSSEVLGPLMLDRRSFGRTFRVFLLAVALVSAPAAALLAGEPVPGTKVSLAPPAGFVPAEQFPGFQKADAASSIMVTEMAAPADQVRAGMTAEGLATRGITLLASKPGSVSNLGATLLHVAQSAGGAVFEKWMLVFGDKANTVIVVATYPQALAASLSEPMRRSVLSTRWDPAREVGLFDGLKFRIAESGSLKFARRVSNMIMLTKAGDQGPVAPGEPFAVVGASLSQVDVAADLAGFARQRLAQTAEITGLANLAGRTTTVDGLPAYELTAEATDQKTGTPLNIYQLVAADGSDYFLIQGLVGRAQGQRFLPEFRQIAESLTRAR